MFESSANEILNASEVNAFEDHYWIPGQTYTYTPTTFFCCCFFSVRRFRHAANTRSWMSVRWMRLRIIMGYQARPTPTHLLHFSVVVSSVFEGSGMQQILDPECQWGECVWGSLWDTRPDLHLPTYYIFLLLFFQCSKVPACSKYEILNDSEVNAFEDHYGIPGQTYTCFYNPQRPGTELIRVRKGAGGNMVLHTILWSSCAMIGCLVSLLIVYWQCGCGPWKRTCMERFGVNFDLDGEPAPRSTATIYRL